MREHKYRVWNKKLNKFIGKFDLNALTEFTAFSLINEGSNLNLQGYTGKKSKNGVEIYEGDIVKVPLDKHLRVIEWSEDEASFKARMLPNEERYIEPLYMNEGNMEVVGNIYENQELLQK